MSAKDADDAGDAGDVVHYGHPPKNTRFLTPRGDAHLDLAVLSLPFPLIPISSQDLNLTSFARVSCIFDSFAVSVAVLPSVLFSFRDFSPPPIPRQFPAHPFISQFLFVFHNFHNLFSFPSSVPLV